MVVVLAIQSYPTLRPHGLQPARLLCPWNSPGKSTGMGGRSLLQGIFPTRRSNPGLLHCRLVLYRLSYWDALAPSHLCNKGPRLGLFPKNISEVRSKAEMMCPPPETGNFQHISNVNTPATNLHEEGAAWLSPTTSCVSVSVLPDENCHSPSA